MPEIEQTCPSCGESYKAPSEWIGGKVECPACKTAFTVRDTAQAPPGKPKSFLPFAAGLALLATLGIAIFALFLFTRHSPDPPADETAVSEEKKKPTSRSRSAPTRDRPLTLQDLVKTCRETRQFSIGEYPYYTDDGGECRLYLYRDKVNVMNIGLTDISIHRTPDAMFCGVSIIGIEEIRPEDDAVTRINKRKKILGKVSAFSVIAEDELGDASVRGVDKGGRRVIWIASENRLATIGCLSETRSGLTDEELLKFAGIVEGKMKVIILGRPASTKATVAKRPPRPRPVRAVPKKGDEKIDALVRQLKHGGANSRVGAAARLGEMRAKSAVQPLIEALKDEEEQVRYMAAQSLGFIGDKSAVRPLSGVLQDKAEDKKVRRYAAYALGRIGDKSAIKALCRMLKNRDAVVRKAAATGLGVTKDKSIVDPLMEVLKTDEEASVRREAGGALARTKDKRAVDLLIETLRYEDKKIHALVSKLLAQMTGQTFGSDYDKWKEWWRENRSD